MKNLECDKFCANNMEVKNIGRKRMKEIKKDVDCGNRTIRVVLQFPDESEDAVMIQKYQKRVAIREVALTMEEWMQLKAKIPTWQQVFQNADAETQRVLVNKLVDRIDVTDEQIVIRFKLNLNDFLPRISGDSGTHPQMVSSGIKKEIYRELIVRFEPSKYRTSKQPYEVMGL